MPNLDKTGPKGEGLGTGLGRGVCTTENTNTNVQSARSARGGKGNLGRECRWSKGLGLGQGGRMRSNSINDENK